MQVFLNQETQSLVFDRTSLLWRYVFSRSYECRYVCQQYVDNHWHSVAIAHFSKNIDNEYWIAGAVPRRSFNSGIGIYTAVAFINEFFKEHPHAIVKSGSFISNVRAYRTTLSLGFVLDKKDDRHFESSLSKGQFNNEFVNKIRSRINLDT